MTVSSEDIGWKLARCEKCKKYRMMPEVNAMCLECERKNRDTALSAEDLRWVISYREPESFVRGAWKLAGEDTNAAMGLDLTTGAVVVNRWAAGQDMPPWEVKEVLVLAVCPASRRAELPDLLLAGSEGMLSTEAAEELAVEVVVKSAMGDGGERFWAGVDAQLREMPELYGSDAKKGDACT